MLTILSKTFDELNNKNINYLHFKSNEHLEDALRGKTDLDILAQKDQAGLIEEVLRKYNYKRAVSQGSMVYPGVDDWIGMDYDTGELVHIHLHYHLITGNKFVKQYELPWSNIAFESSIMCKESHVKISIPEFEMMLLLVRCFFKSSMLTKLKCHFGFDWMDNNSKKEFAFLKEQISEKKILKMCDSLFNQFECRDFSFLVYTILSGKNKGKEYGRFFKMIRKEIIECKKGTLFDNDFKSKIRVLHYYIVQIEKRKLSIWWKIIKKAPHSGGVAIAFVGCDGSGKSTLVHDIRKWLAWKYDCTSIYLGAGEGYIDLYKQLRKMAVNIIKILKKGTDSKTKKELHELRGHIERQPIISWIERKHNIHFAKIIRKRLLRMNQYRMLGGIAIMDRYPQIQFDGINDGVKTSSQFAFDYKKEKQYLSIVNKIQPDVVFRLNVPLEIAMQRKPYERKDILLRKIDILPELQFGCKTIDIDATTDYTDELLDIKRYIWEIL